MNSKIICVTGNIASGKTTLAQLLGAAIPDSCYVPEPYQDNPFLPLYLNDKPRWGFTAQLRYFHDYVQTFVECTADRSYQYCFVDTGLWTNRAVYARYLADEKLMTQDEYAFYIEMSNTILRADPIPEPSAYIFVQASPQICLERMRDRGWEYQVNAVELEYVESLHRYLQAMQASVTPVLVLSSEAVDFRTEKDKALSQVLDFLK